MTGTRLGDQVLVAGSANIDFVVRAPHIPAPGETVLGSDLIVVPGGKGANQAVACARAGGASTTMLAALGDDPFATMIEMSLRDAGVALATLRKGGATGAALITVSDDAENAITVAPGANAFLRVEDVTDLERFGWLVMQLESPLPTVVALARAARLAGVQVLLNAAPAQALPDVLLTALDVLVVNEAELVAITGLTGTIVDRLRRVGVGRVVVTLGNRGCCGLIEGAVVLQSAFRVDAIDTTAAGDTFVGVLAAALAQRKPFAAAMHVAAAAAALATTRIGAQTSVPSSDEVLAFMAQAGVACEKELAAYCGLDG